MDPASNRFPGCILEEMDESGFLKQLDSLLELDEGTLTGAEKLVDLEAWSSLSVIGFMALVNDEFGAVVSPRKIAECTTVSDLVKLALHP